ncbi:MAG TPA: thrombospondin type 3 repeat-containing protein [Chthoniobacter sp.]|jgi:hypothetical protein
MFWIFTLGLAVTAVAWPVPSDKPANYPDWWFQWGVILPTNLNNQSPSWASHDYPSPDDYAVANIGQLKEMAHQAASVMNATLQTKGGAGAEINTMIGAWTSPAGQGVVRDDYAALNLGQLKMVASLFYNQLILDGLATANPCASGPDDYATVNLGQLKNIFSFSLPSNAPNPPGGPGDPAPFGIPAAWWTLYNIVPVDPTTTLSADGHLTLWQKYINGLNPNVADTDGDGFPDWLELQSGTNPVKKDAPLVQLQVGAFTTP